MRQLDQESVDGRGFSASRRSFLTAACGLAASGTASCRPEGPVIPADVLAAIPLGSLPVGQRVVLPVHDRPVEFLRRPDGVSARSLNCTHLGCEVAWVEADRRYRCPCHEGTFDEDGRVLAGPPPKPLRTFSVTIQGELALVRA